MPAWLVRRGPRSSRWQSRGAIIYWHRARSESRALQHFCSATSQQRGKMSKRRGSSRRLTTPLLTSGMPVCMAQAWLSCISTKRQSARLMKRSKLLPRHEMWLIPRSPSTQRSRRSAVSVKMTRRWHLPLMQCRRLPLYTWPVICMSFTRHGQASTKR